MPPSPYAPLLASLLRIQYAYESTDTATMTVDDAGRLHVAIRGTVDSDDICANANAHLTSLDIPGLEDDYAHAGFVEILHDVLPPVLCSIHRISHVTVTGHSLGGAVATLLGYVLRKTVSDLQVTVHTFGSPRVCARSFARRFNASGVASTRVVLDRDVVPTVPFFGYQHPHHLVWLNHDGTRIRPGVRTSVAHFLKFQRHDVADHCLSSYLEAVARYEARVHVPPSLR